MNPLTIETEQCLRSQGLADVVLGLKFRLRLLELTHILTTVRVWPKMQLFETSCSRPRALSTPCKQHSTAMKWTSQVETKFLCIIIKRGFSSKLSSFEH